MICDCTTPGQCQYCGQGLIYTEDIFNLSNPISIMIYQCEDISDAYAWMDKKYE
jgi:hypothetical protein